RPPPAFRPAPGRSPDLVRFPGPFRASPRAPQSAERRNRTLPRESSMRKLATLKRLFDDRALYCQLIVTRRCNLACGYCNEYDSFSKPVPYDELVRRMDHLIDRLGVTIMDFLGGEPLLHPRIADLVRH